VSHPRQKATATAGGHRRAASAFTGTCVADAAVSKTAGRRPSTPPGSLPLVVVILVADS